MQRSTYARIELAKKEREDNNERYLQYSLRLGALKNDRARTVRDLEAQHEAQRMEQQRQQWAEQEHKWKEALQRDMQREQAGRATLVEKRAETAGIEAEYAPEYLQEQINTERQKGQSYRAKATESYASAGAHNRSNPLIEEKTEVETAESTDNRGKPKKTSKSKTTSYQYVGRPKSDDNTPPSRRKK